MPTAWLLAAPATLPQRLMTLEPAFQRAAFEHEQVVANDAALEEILSVANDGIGTHHGFLGNNAKCPGLQYLKVGRRHIECDGLRRLVL